MLSFILSIIGCLTGAASLLINILKYLSERPKIKISQSISYDLSYFFKASELSTFKAPYHSFVYVGLSNESPKPITITKIKLNLNESDNVFAINCKDNYPCFHFKFKNDNERTLIDLKADAIRIPLRLDSYEYINGYLFFPFTPELPNHIINTTITIFTTRGEFSKEIVLKPLPIDDFSNRFRTLEDLYYLPKN